MQGCVCVCICAAHHVSQQRMRLTQTASKPSMHCEHANTGVNCQAGEGVAGASVNGFWGSSLDAPASHVAVFACTPTTHAVLRPIRECHATTAACMHAC